MKLPSVLPDAMLRRMSAADRKALGKAGLTRSDCEQLAQAKNERELQKQIVGLLRVNDIEVNVSRMDKRTTHRKGWPDITFAVYSLADQYTCKGKSDLLPKAWQTFSVAWEVKFGNGKLSPDQEKLAARLTAPPNGWRFRVIRSLSDAIVELRELGIGAG